MSRSERERGKNSVYKEKRIDENGESMRREGGERERERERKRERKREREG